MQIRNILFENVGSIKNLNYQFPFDNQENLKPEVIVGQNGSGKTIFLSYIVNSLISAKQTLYTNPVNST